MHDWLDRMADVHRDIAVAADVGFSHEGRPLRALIIDASGAEDIVVIDGGKCIYDPRQFMREERETI